MIKKRTRKTQCVVVKVLVFLGRINESNNNNKWNNYDPKFDMVDSVLKQQRDLKL